MHLLSPEVAAAAVAVVAFVAVEVFVGNEYDSIDFSCHPVAVGTTVVAHLAIAIASNP